MSLITLALFLITWLIQAAQTFKTIPDLKALGYDVYGSNPASGDWVHYEVSHGATFLADLAIYKNNDQPDVLAVFNAQTADDDRPGRLPLRDILLGVWVHSVGRDPADLLAIQYRDVYEDDLVVATHRVYGLMGESESQDLMQVIPTCIYIPEYKYNFHVPGGLEADLFPTMQQGPPRPPLGRGGGGVRPAPRRDRVRCRSAEDDRRVRGDAWQERGGVWV